MALMDEHRTGCSGTRVHIFVGAPRRAVHVPIMELQGHISGGVGHVPDDHRSDGMGGRSDCWNVKELPGAESHAG